MYPYMEDRDAAPSAALYYDLEHARKLILQYDPSDGKIDGVSVAAKIGRDPETVFKTLVTTGKTTGLNVFIIPVECELAPEELSRVSGADFCDLV